MGELAKCAVSGIKQPDMALPLIAFWWLGDYKRDARAVRREFDFRHAFDTEQRFRSDRFLAFISILRGGDVEGCNQQEKRKAAGQAAHEESSTVGTKECNRAAH